MAAVTYDDGSFFLDEQRIWLVSGSVHYFRIPSELWPDRLLKAKRAGLNCISTCVAWNVHEPTEGNWDLDGDQDVVSFVRLAEEMGLYVILRPGPFIGAQWDFGGLPGWLMGKSGMALRSSNAAYTHYFDKYFRQVLPKLAEYQVTRGGNIILIQNEHEYTLGTMPDRLSYLEFINQLLRRGGFDIPIINCNRMTDPPVPENIECVNGWDSTVRQLKRLRSRQPNAPLLVTEHWTGSPDHWGRPHETRDARSVARKALEILGCGAQYNYYVWAGGTNFGFKAGSLPGLPDGYQTTSFDFDAPVAEGGGLTEKYYTTRLVNLLAQHMGKFFAATYVQEPGVTVHDSTSTLNLLGSTGRWAIVTNNGREDISEARVSLPEGKELTVSLEAIGATAIPMDLVLTEQHRLDYTNLMPLGFFKQHLLVLHGPVGWDGRVSVNDVEKRVTVSDQDEPAILEWEGLSVAVINSSLAMRTWVTDEALVLGPTFMGPEEEDIVCDPQATQYAMISMEGKVSHKKTKPGPAPKVAAPRLGTWKRVSVCAEPLDGKLEWQKLDRPRDTDHLGVHEGYVWYRLVLDQPRAHRRQLFLPQCEDRAILYLNGKRLGTWGRGAGAARLPIKADFKKGPNVLVMLVDNLGRPSGGQTIDQRKGLFGHIYDAKELRLGKFKLKEAEAFPKRVVPRTLACMIEQLQAMPVWEAQVSLSLTKVVPIHVCFQDIPHHVVILCNERTVAYIPRQGRGFGEALISSELKKGRNVLKFLLWGDVDGKCLQNVQFHSLLETLTLKGKMSYRPWQLPAEGDPAVGQDRPTWYRCEFRHVPEQRPVFLRLAGSGKGQVFVNGHNLGRFWAVGPQELTYVPECWLSAVNEVQLFCEDGKLPKQCRLELRPLGPYRDR